MTSNKVCLIGCGRIGELSASILFNLDSLVVIVDPNEEKRIVAEKFGCKFYLDLDDLFEDLFKGIISFDSFVVSTPTNLHYSTLLKIIPFQKNIFVESPFCKSHLESRIILEKLNGYPFFVTIGFTDRFNSVVQTIKRKLNLVGTLQKICINDVHASQDIKDSCESLPGHVLENGVCTESLGNAIDLMRYLTNENIEVVISRKDFISQPFSQIKLDYQVDCMMKMQHSGILGSIRCGWMSKNKNSSQNSLGGPRLEIDTESCFARSTQRVDQFPEGIERCENRSIHIIGDRGELFGDLINKIVFYTDITGKIHDIIVDDVEPMKYQHLDFLTKTNLISATPREACDVTGIVEKIKESDFYVFSYSTV